MLIGGRGQAQIYQLIVRSLPDMQTALDLQGRQCTFKGRQGSSRGALNSLDSNALGRTVEAFSERML